MLLCGSACQTYLVGDGDDDGDDDGGNIYGLSNTPVATEAPNFQPIRVEDQTPETLFTFFCRLVGVAAQAPPPQGPYKATRGDDITESFVYSR